MTEPTVDWIGPGGQKLAGPDGAVAAEIQEYDDQGVPAGRTYAELSPPPRVVLAQTAEEEDIADPESADFYGKGTWDMWEPTTLEPVEHVSQLLSALGAGEDPGSQRAALLGALELPSWQAAPDGLKTEAYAWLDAHAAKTAGTDG